MVTTDANLAAILRAVDGIAKQHHIDATCDCPTCAGVREIRAQGSMLHDLLTCVEEELERAMIHGQADTPRLRSVLGTVRLANLGLRQSPATDKPRTCRQPAPLPRDF